MNAPDQDALVCFLCWFNQLIFDCIPRQGPQHTLFFFKAPTTNVSLPIVCQCLSFTNSRMGGPFPASPSWASQACVQGKACKSHFLLERVSRNLQLWVAFPFWVRTFKCMFMVIAGKSNCNDVGDSVEREPRLPFSNIQVD